MVAYDAPELPLLRVLLIEDDADDRLLLSRTLQACTSALRLDLADNVERAVARLGTMECMPHVIFADLRMPGIPTLELLHWMRRRREFAGVWFVAVTGDLKLATLPPKFHGADAVLVKPVARDDLAALLALAGSIRQPAPAVD